MMGVFWRAGSVVATLATVAITSGFVSYAAGYREGAKLPTSEARMLSETWNRSSDATDRLIKTLEEYLQCKEQTP